MIDPVSIQGGCPSGMGIPTLEKTAGGAYRAKKTIYPLWKTSAYATDYTEHFSLHYLILS
jgi:hypothetical protein